MYIKHPKRSCKLCNITEKEFKKQHPSKKLRWRSNPFNREEWWCQACGIKQQGLGKKSRTTIKRRKTFLKRLDAHNSWIRTEYGDELSQGIKVSESNVGHSSGSLFLFFHLLG
jgi:hypothetical protein